MAMLSLAIISYYCAITSVSQYVDIPLSVGKHSTKSKFIHEPECISRDKIVSLGPSGIHVG